MKRLISLILLFSIFSTASGMPLIEENHNSAEKTLRQIFDLVKSGDFNAALQFVALPKKSKKNDEWTVVDKKNKGEVKAGKRLLSRIKKYLKISDGYKIERSESDGNISVVAVKFSNKGRKIKIEFEFVKMKTNYFLVDID